MNHTRLDLHIDALVLDGLGGVDPAGVAAAVRHELARLVAAHGVPAPMHSTGGAARLDAGNITVAPDAAAETVGVQVALAVYGSMGGTVKP